MHVLILTEGSLSWGLGHLYRCLGFAKHFADKGFTVKWLVNGDGMAADFLAKQAIDQAMLLDWSAPGSLSGHLDGCLCAIVDSYHAPQECYEIIAAAVPHRIWVDDEARIRYPPGTVVNPNPLVARRLEGSRDEGAEILSGFEYQLLREEFSRPSQRMYEEDVRRVLVMMGGTDLRRLTPRVVETVRATLPDAMLDVIVPSDRDRAEWAHLASDQCVLHGTMDARGVCGLMQRADLAVTAAGQTLCEAASQGLPTLAIGVAENQRIHAEALQDAGAIRFVGWHDDPRLLVHLAGALVEARSVSIRRSMGGKGLATIDGKGVRRIVCAAMDWSDRPELRRAVSSDSEKVWKISNHPSVREHSINRSGIPWEEHEAWFSRALVDPELLFHVAELDGEVVGQLRYKRAPGNACAVSISLSPEARGKGVASRLLKEGDSRCFSAWSEIERIEAEISPHNTASAKVFSRAGYLRGDETREHGGNSYGVYRKERRHA